MAARLQRRRTKDWRTPIDDLGRKAVYVGRGSRWGNPWRLVRHADGTHGVVNDALDTRTTHPTETSARAAAAAEYETWLATPNTLVAVRHACEHSIIRQDLGLLHGRDLLCWCPLPAAGEPDHCHGAVLLALANAPR
ncbi:DUF4326 domain-containing protein [Streptomyces tsukubensis]|uniref:DUF4326 domain-containing protein n=1 Tax=Streptomyces tsukubensis TaxID=83656 RepID=UPI00344EE522